MANNPQIQTNYGGEFLNPPLTHVTQGDEHVSRGALHLDENAGDSVTPSRRRG